MQRKSARLLYIAALQIPCFLIYTVLFIIPTIQVVYLSFFDWNGMQKVTKLFIGFQNYTRLLHDGDFYRTLLNSLIFVVVALAVTLPFSFGIALLVNTGIRGKGFFKLVYYIPAVLPITVSGLLWAFLLSPAGNLMNPDSIVTRIIQIFIGQEIHINWLSDKQLAIWTVTLVDAWRQIGFYMLFFLAGLASISHDMIEASFIDGAGPYKRLFFIIIPSMKETFKIFLVLNLASAFQIFDIVYVMTAGGPGNATQVPVTLLYNYAFRYFGSFGYGSSIGVVLLIITLVIAYITNRAANQKD